MGAYYIGIPHKYCRQATYCSGVSRIWRREVQIFLATPPKCWSRPLINAFLKEADYYKEGWVRPGSDDKLLFKERISEASKFIVGSSCQLSIISDNSCQWIAELAVVPELRGVLQLPELHARYATVLGILPLHTSCWHKKDVFCEKLQKSVSHIGTDWKC